MPLSRVALVPIPGGAIEVRDARTGSTRSVTLLPFELARTAVTIETDGHHVPAGEATKGGTEAGTVHPDVPVHPVTWFDAVRWCNRASLAEGLRPAYGIVEREVEWEVSADGYRLPTEAEWEWACRAGTTGPTYGPLPAIAWTGADSVDRPQPVARKAPNDFGLFDTIGNVWEWCWDYADPARYGEYRSLRGGGWADREWSCRASVRRGSAPDAVLEDVGFRVARGAVGPAGARAAQGWSAEADRRRGTIGGPLPVGWTPLGRVAGGLSSLHAAGMDQIDHPAGSQGESTVHTPRDPVAVEALWDERYAGLATLWSGQPNAALIREVEALPAGRVLDVGCGEGADALWLAEHGWEVTALDVSQVALDRAAGQAELRGQQVRWLHAGLVDAALPPASFDLVSAQYPALLHTAENVAERALLAAVAPDGVLLIVHHPVPSKEQANAHGYDPADYVSPADVAALLDDAWRIEVDETRPRHVATGAGSHHIEDVVLRVRRLA